MSQSPMNNIIEIEDKAHSNSTLSSTAIPTNLNHNHYLNHNLNMSNYGSNPNISPPNVLINSQTSPQAIPRLKCDENPCNKIFVGGLSWDTTQEKLYEYFSAFGPIIDCILMLDGATGRSRGFGFVTFIQQESVKSVLAVKQHILDSKIIDPKEAVPKYIKDIENRVNSTQQQSNCHTSVNNYGCINGCGSVVGNGAGNNNISVVVATQNTSNSHNNGGVKSSTKQSLSRRSSVVGGEQVPVATNSFSCQHNSPIPSSCFLCPNVIHNTKIFVGGIGHASELDLRDYFSTFGTVVDVNIMMDKSTGRPRGFAFIGFSTNEAADLTASMRYHCVRNKQVEVKKALPKDTKYLSVSNQSNVAVISENHPIIPSKINSHNSKNSYKNYNALNYDYPFHTTNTNNLNITYDESIASHDLHHQNHHISTVNLTPAGTTNCSLLSGGSAMGNDDRTTTNFLHSAAYGGEWDFDDVIHLDDHKSGMTFNNIGGTNSPLHNATQSGILVNNTNQSNVPIHPLKNFMNENVNGSLQHRQDNALFELSNNRSSCNRQPQECAPVFDSYHNLNVASSCNPTTMDRIQPMRFSSVGDTTTMLSSQIPDDTKNSIVELLNEIWKGNG